LVLKHSIQKLILVGNQLADLFGHQCLHTVLTLIPSKPEHIIGFNQLELCLLRGNLEIGLLHSGK
jgi:hypothetical protein